MGADGSFALELPCGETLSTSEIDMGLREFECACGDRHAVVLDVHPPSRFVPEELVETLRTVIDNDDGFGEFGTPHLMGMVLEEFPDRVVTYDAAENRSVGYAMAWITTFDARRLHEVIVEMIVDLMEHAMSHAETEQASAFEEYLSQFDVEAFVEEYRRERDFEGPTE
ncbi:MAG: DUF5815 family protein [Salinarchaeum sp.]